MLRKFLFVILCIIVVAPATADDECPKGYTLEEYTEYTELEYIESTGIQYINTAYIPPFHDSTKTIRIISEFEALESTNWKFFITNLRANDYIYAIARQEIGKDFIVEYGYARTNLVHTGVSEGKIKIETISSNNDFSVIANDNFIADGQCYSAPSERDSLLLMYESKYKTYGFSVYVDDVLVQKLVPVKRVLDNKIGMYDTVSETFLENMGAGDFIAGPDRNKKIGKIVCSPCPDNTYKPNVGNENCTQCPDGSFSPIASTSQDQCGRILHIGGYVAFMPVGRRTEHGLCTMLDGKKYCADLYEKK